MLTVHDKDPYEVFSISVEAIKKCSSYNPVFVHSDDFGDHQNLDSIIWIEYLEKVLIKKAKFESKKKYC